MVSFEIDIKNEVDSKKGSKVLEEFLRLNNSGTNFLQHDGIKVGYNNKSRVTWCYLQGFPNIGIGLSSKDRKFYIYYSSPLDGIEFKLPLKGIKSLDELEEIQHEAYELEEKIRDDDYDDDSNTEKWVEAMEKKGWISI